MKLGHKRSPPREPTQMKPQEVRHYKKVCIAGRIVNTQLWLITTLQYCALPIFQKESEISFLCNAKYLQQLCGRNTVHLCEPHKTCCIHMQPKDHQYAAELANKKRRQEA